VSALSGDLKKRDHTLIAKQLQGLACVNIFFMQMSPLKQGVLL
jgi:hypothetical protein